jgi:hypothetical protein
MFNFNFTNVKPYYTIHVYFSCPPIVGDTRVCIKQTIGGHCECPPIVAVLYIDVPQKSNIYIGQSLRFCRNCYEIMC